MSFHSFRASVDASRCLFCNLPEAEHTCSVCNATDKTLQKMAGMLYCESCIKAEEEAYKENQRHAEARVNEVKTRVPEPDTSIVVVTDIFNSHIQSIDSKRHEIESDTSIQNKHLELAQWMETRYLHLKDVITQTQNTLKDAQNETRAIQTYYNDLAKKLKAEERERIRIADVQYHPPEKPVKKPKAPTVSKPFSSKEIKEASGLSNIPEAILTMICKQRNCNVKDAIQYYKQATTKE